MITGLNGPYENNFFGMHSKKVMTTKDYTPKSFSPTFITELVNAL